MSSAPRAVVGFVFALVRKRERTTKELTAVPSISVQAAFVRAAYTGFGWDLVGLKVAATTYRAKAFTDEPAFQEAVSEALSKGAILLIGDIFGNLRNLDTASAARCFDVLDRAGVEIFNAFDARSWASFTPAERRHLHLTASRSAAQRSRAIKNAIRDRDPGSADELAKRQKRGAASGARNADRRAKALAPVIREIRKGVSSDAASDAELARELNDRGVRPPRGDQWSSVTAKRLRLRLQKLGLLDG